jgi:hypothetical protein
MIRNIASINRSASVLHAIGKTDKPHVEKFYYGLTRRLPRFDLKSAESEKFLEAEPSRAPAAVASPYTIGNRGRMMKSLLQDFENWPIEARRSAAA